MESDSKLEGDTNYKDWKVRVEIFLESNTTLGIVTGKVT